MSRTPTIDKSSDTLLPPEERFWQRYSSHHEAPLSGVGSFVLHGLVIGVLALAYLLLTQRRESETNRPVSMDVVQLEGGGTGFEGAAGGGEPGPKGPLNKAGRTEDVFGSKNKQSEKIELTPPSFEKIPTTPILNLPENTEFGAPEIDQALKEVAQQADAAVKKAMKIAASEGGKTGDPEGGKTVGKEGKGSLNGSGKGNKGGVGQGGPGGKLTRAEIYAQRWEFDLGGGPREHVAKLDAAGIILAVPDPRGNFYLIRDFRRRPAKLLQENLEPFKDAVKWYNVSPASLAGLTRELRLPFTPQYVVLLLPKEREQLVADAEQAYADKMGRPVNTIQQTSFDFQLRGGGFQPVVIRQK